jgi:SAM-dependent methyltransferase
VSIEAQPTWRERWEDHYASGHTPWDTQITPPEVEAFWATGRLGGDGLALDIGCGPGTNVLYLARRGLTAIGFDIALQPLLTGRERIDRRAPEVAARTHFVQADVTRLPIAGAGAAYILDVGCFHGVRPDQRDDYVAGIVANLRPGGYYQLYAFDRTPEMTADPDRKLMGVEENEIAQRFASQLTIVEIVRARPDRYPCRWYLLQRL